uniref:PDZ domain-containing protein n=1 Tax=Neogobius melanostomus TaxID=47308 RepID=A0A8C6TUV5_9GOBI
MDFLSMSGSEYNTRTGPHFTVRSANSLSYSLERRPVRTSRHWRDEEESTDMGQRGTEPVSYDQSKTYSVGKRQSLERHNQNGTQVKNAESVSGQGRNSERRGRTEWRSTNLSSRSQSLDWRTGATSPERKQSCRENSWRITRDLIGTDGSKVSSTTQAYNNVRSSNNNNQDMTLSKARGQSLPSKFASASLGLKGGQSILERIEKLYGSSELGNTGDYKTTEPQTYYKDSFVKRSSSAKAIETFSWGGIREEREQSGSKTGLEKEDQNIKSDEALDKFSKLKGSLELPLIKDLEPTTNVISIDETDFSKIASPEKDVATSTSSSSSESSPTTSDDDRTPTNTPDSSPPPSPIALPQKTPQFAPVSTPSKEPSPAPVTKLPDLISRDNLNGKKRVLDLNAWLDGLNPQVTAWDNDKEDDDDSTQRDDDSNYDSDSGESSVTVTSVVSNKSFSVSLADLCNFAGVDYDSENDSDEWQSPGRRTASLSSDMSGFSYVSVLPTEELDKLMKMSRDFEDVHVVVLHKEIGVGLGFSLAGGVDQNKPVTVHKVFHSGVAAQEGSIKEGDQVLSINGTALSGFAHWEALRVLRRSKGREMGVVVLKKPDTRAVSKGRALAHNQAPTPPQCIRVNLEKNDRDLGFSLEGGVDCSLGNKPLSVQKIFQGGPVDKILPGDEVLEVNGVSVVGMRRLEAWTLIRKLPPGPVSVVLRRQPTTHKT